MVPGFLAYCAVVFIFGFHLIWTKPAMDSGSGLKYEEYVIEHEISTSQARNVVLSNNFNSLTSSAGCEECTKGEMRYCMSTDLISDHCCCDKRYHETVPYIPHTCYFGPHLCSPVAGDCSKYSRLMDCCCDKYLLPKWREKLANHAKNCELSAIFTLILIIVYFLV